MRHLTPEQFVDVADGTAPESSLPHLSGCDACRRQLAEMRASLSEMSAGADRVDVPEPSPLFWDHLSSRVREAVAEDAARRPSWLSSREWLRQPRVLGMGLAGVFAVAIIAILAPREVMAPPAPVIPSSPLNVIVTAPSVSPSVPLLAPLGKADDPQLTIVAAVATTVDWDEMRDEVALATTSDAVAASLTLDEQQELKRLLAEAMARPDAVEKRS